MKVTNIAQRTGRRKTAVARVHMRQGNGTITVNGRKFNEYFPLELQQEVVRSPIQICGITQQDFVITISGGGLEGQAVAARLGIARCLVKEDEDRRKILKDHGFLTRDPRKRERKKYGKRGARKSTQFSKR